MYYTVINEAACCRGAEGMLHGSEKDLITGVSELDFQEGSGCWCSLDAIVMSVLAGCSSLANLKEHLSLFYSYFCAR